MTLEKFTDIYRRASERKGGESALESMLVEPASQDQLLAISDDRWLSALTQRVFQCGMNWKVVRKKWPGFEDVFWQFDIDKMRMVPPDMWERKATDPAIIRHLGKVMANAEMIHRAARDHASFSEFVANWPTEDITGLWRYMKKHGSRLGGNTGPYTLRMMGKDTFVLSGDVEGYLRATHE